MRARTCAALPKGNNTDSNTSGTSWRNDSFILSVIPANAGIHLCHSGERRNPSLSFQRTPESILTTKKPSEAAAGRFAF